MCVCVSYPVVPVRNGRTCYRCVHVAVWGQFASMQTNLEGASPHRARTACRGMACGASSAPWAARSHRSGRLRAARDGVGGEGRAGRGEGAGGWAGGDCGVSAAQHEIASLILRAGGVRGRGLGVYR